MKTIFVTRDEAREAYKIGLAAQNEGLDFGGAHDAFLMAAGYHYSSAECHCENDANEGHSMTCGWTMSADAIIEGRLALHSIYKRLDRAIIDAYNRGCRLDNFGRQHFLNLCAALSIVTNKMEVLGVDVDAPRQISEVA